MPVATLYGVKVFQTISSTKAFVSLHHNYITLLTLIIGQFDKDFPTFVSGLPQGLLKYMIAESVKARTYLIDTFDKLKDQYANQVRELIINF